MASAATEVENSSLTSNGHAPTIGYSAACALGGNMVFRAAQWSMLAALTKCGTSQDVAQFGMAQAICNPFVVFAYLQLGQIMAADAAGDYSFRTYRRIRAVAMAAAVLLIAAACIIVPALRSAWLVVLLLAITKFADGQSDVYQGLLRQIDRLDIVAKLQCLRGAATIVLFAGLYWWTRSLASSLFGLAVGWTVLIFIADQPLSIRHATLAGLKPSTRKTSSRELRRLAITALPMGVVSALAALYTYIPQYLILAICRADDYAAFVVVDSLPLVFETVVLATIQASSARFGLVCHRSDRASFWRLYRQMLWIQGGLGAAGVFAAWLFGRQALFLAYSEHFAHYHDLLLWVMAGSAVGAAASFNAVFLALKRYHTFLKLWIVAAIVLVIAGAVLTPIYGATGAAIAVLIANTVRCLLNHLAIYRLATTAFSKPARLSSAAWAA